MSTSPGHPAMGVPRPLMVAIIIMGVIHITVQNEEAEFRPENTSSIIPASSEPDGALGIHGNLSVAVSSVSDGLGDPADGLVVSEASAALDQEETVQPVSEDPGVSQTSESGSHVLSGEATSVSYAEPIAVSVISDSSYQPQASDGGQGAVTPGGQSPEVSSTPDGELTSQPSAEILEIISLTAAVPDITSEPAADGLEVTSLPAVEVPEVTSMPAVVPEVTSMPSVVPEVTSMPAVVPEVTSMPSVVPEVTSMPTVEVPEVTSMPAVVPEVTSLPAVVPEVTSLPAVVPEVTSIPTVVPEVTSLPAVAVPEVTSLPAVAVPEVTSIPTVVPEVTSLPAVAVPEVTSLPAVAVPEVTSLPAVEVPEVTSIPTVEVPEVTSLPAVEIPKVTSIPASEEQFISSSTVGDLVISVISDDLTAASLVSAENIVFTQAPDAETSVVSKVSKTDIVISEVNRQHHVTYDSGLGSGISPTVTSASQPGATGYPSVLPLDSSRIIGNHIQTSTEASEILPSFTDKTAVISGSVFPEPSEIHSSVPLIFISAHPDMDDHSSAGGLSSQMRVPVVSSPTPSLESVSPLWQAESSGRITSGMDPTQTVIQPTPTSHLAAVSSMVGEAGNDTTVLADSAGDRSTTTVSEAQGTDVGQPGNVTVHPGQNESTPVPYELNSTRNTTAAILDSVSSGVMRNESMMTTLDSIVTTPLTDVNASDSVHSYRSSNTTLTVSSGTPELLYMDDTSTAGSDKSNESQPIEATTTASEEVTTIASEEATTIASEEATTVASEEATTTASEEVTTITSEEATTIASEEATTIASEEATTIASEEATTASEEATTIASEEATTTVSEEAETMANLPNKVETNTQQVMSTKQVRVFPFTLKPRSTKKPVNKSPKTSKPPAEEFNRLVTKKPVLTTKQPELPSLYIIIRMEMTWPEFCSRIHQFRSLLLKMLQKKILAETLTRFQVVILNEHHCHKPSKVMSKHRRMAQISVHLYIADYKGKYDMQMTDKMLALLQEDMTLEGTAFMGKIVGLKHHGIRKELVDKPSMESEEQNSGIIVAIVVGCVVGTAILAFLVIQIIVWKRRFGVKKMRYTYDVPRTSLDAHSLDESIQLTSLTPNGNGFAYPNHGFRLEDKDFTSNPLTLAGLATVVEDHKLLEEEFLMLPNIMPKLSEVPLGAEDKNRYANVIPIAETRVHLKADDEEDNSDYINANFITGLYCDSAGYIATQAPLEHTRADFWRMVWEQQSQVIIMLTDLEEQGLSKCAEYWPNSDRTDTLRIYGDYEVLQQKREVKPDWKVSTLLLKNMESNLCREILHFWFTAWPSHGLPRSAQVVMKFLEEVQPYMEDSHGPTVVHCSPGTGRTGTILAIDVCLRQGAHTEQVDILNCVFNMRHERAGAVQTKEQYFFIYKVLYEYMYRLANPSMSSRSSSVVDHNRHQGATHIS